ncbi:MAG: YHS domain-containing protein [Candidatus Omnitrophica bacterium]|nr:YHS domain-containing protein [Candidatus Omnitrophota bacterium]
MKKLFLLGIVALSMIAAVSVSRAQTPPCAGDPAKALVEDQEAASSAAEAVVDVGNKICPVMGNPINENSKVTYEYEGRIYHFCCPACIEAFKNDPQKYMQKVDEELASLAEEVAPLSEIAE